MCSYNTHLFVVCLEGKAADASCSKTLDFELVVVTSTRTTTATTVSTSVSNSSHAPLALTSSGDGAEPWHDVHRSTRCVFFECLLVCTYFSKCGIVSGGNDYIALKYL